ncbi:MAG: diglucosylglycerate octanoyltransferase [Motilibacteraceae bacterium]
MVDGSERGRRRLLVLGDSLTFHGPERVEPLTEPRLWPHVAAALLGERTGQPWAPDVVARLGWTARDAWWALTRDPRMWSVAVPRADVLVLAVGQMDQLPAALPTWLRESIPYVRPSSVRRRVRRAYRAASPHLVRAHRGRLRMLPQGATDHYLSRILHGVRYYRPELPVVLLGPSPWGSSAYPVHTTHRPAVTAARHWAAREGVPLLELDDVVRPHLAAGRNNPDGLHWGWEVHREVGQRVAAALGDLVGP